MIHSPASTPAEDPIADSKRILLMRIEQDQEIATNLKHFRHAQPGSVLEQDERALGNYSPSALVFDLLVTAAHVSKSLQQLIVVEAEECPSVSVPLHGPYALVRAHLEATSQALWLITPHSRNERIKRCLQYWCAEVKLLNGFQTEWSKSFFTPNWLGPRKVVQ